MTIGEYYSDDKIEGIVWEVDESGKPIIIMSLKCYCEEITEFKLNEGWFIPSPKYLSKSFYRNCFKHFGNNTESFQKSLDAKITSYGGEPWFSKRGIFWNFIITSNFKKVDDFVSLVTVRNDNMHQVEFVTKTSKQEMFKIRLFYKI